MKKRNTREKLNIRNYEKTNIFTPPAIITSPALDG
jgi:hypothetical protein